MSEGPSVYRGTELPLFARATTWRHYIRRHVQPFVMNAVLEVGAGMGTTTKTLINERVTAWTCVEPDRALVQTIEDHIARGSLPATCRVISGTIEDVSGQFDCILYMDVLEHIEDDLAEVASAAQRLHTGGHLIVLAPAHPWLYTAFDNAIGHYRRYTHAMLRDLTPPSLKIVRSRYLDSAGILASLGNRVLLRSPTPSRGQVMLWDKVLVRLSRGLDPLTRYRVGKSILAVWKKSGDADGA